MGAGERSRLLDQIAQALKVFETWHGAPRPPRPAPPPRPARRGPVPIPQAQVDYLARRPARASMTGWYDPAARVGQDAALLLPWRAKGELFRLRDPEDSWLNDDAFDVEFDWRDDFDCTAALRE